VLNFSQVEAMAWRAARLTEARSLVRLLLAEPRPAGDSVKRDPPSGRKLHDWSMSRAYTSRRRACWEAAHGASAMTSDFAAAMREAEETRPSDLTPVRSREKAT
jgi:hypothetical protein